MRAYQVIQLFAAMLLISGCTNYLVNYDFERTYEEVRKIDSKYNTVLHVEMLGGNMVPKESIEPMLVDLRALAQRVNHSRPNEERETIMLFLDARMLMLESQRNFEIAAKIGTRGLATDGYRCSEMETIAKSRTYLRDAMGQAGLAQDLLDRVIQEEEPQRFLGVNENKPKFYESPLRQISAELKAQKAAILKCMEQQGMTLEQLEQQYGNPLMDNSTQV